MHYIRGKAKQDAIRGWFIGQFVPEEHGLRKRTDVELKWGIHPKGERRGDVWASYRTATTISVLIEGSLIVWLRKDGIEEKILLDEKGDYLIVNPQVEHTWESPEDSIVLSVRCPSVADDLIETTD